MDFKTMKLTNRQLKQLRRTRQQLESPPTILGFFARSWKTYVFILLLNVAVIGFLWWGGWPSVSTFCGGFLLGILARDLRWFSGIVRSWPLNREITDWALVDELLKKADESAT